MTDAALPTRTDRVLLLRVVLAAAGAFILLTGVNVGLGGIATLGLQGPRDFFAVTDPTAFAAQDSHVRFFGGLWLAVGLVFAAGAVRPRALRSGLLLCCGLIFVGGLARFSALQPQVMFGPHLAGSVAAELVGMPLLALWLARLKS